MAEQRSSRFEALDTGTGETSVDVEETGWLTALKRQKRHWKSWLAAAALAATAGVLFSIGGWTLDTASFIVGALLIVAYRVWALRYDVE